MSNMTPRFVLIGAGGYIAPRHMKAIKTVGGDLVAAIDLHDSVGILDSYFPFCEFFTEFERFDRYCELKKKSKTPIDYVVVCSPNWMHDIHSIFGMRIGADIICEKPAAINIRNIENVQSVEAETGRKVNCILQLRYAVTDEQKEKIKKMWHDDRFHQIFVSYHTPRGDWYYRSWKNEVDRSGGLATNIGVHLFDLLSHLLGPCDNIIIDGFSESYIAGQIGFQAGKFKGHWDLSVNIDNAPRRIFEIGDIKFNFSWYDVDHLFEKSYLGILEGNGYRLDSVKDSIKVCSFIREYCYGKT